MITVRNTDNNKITKYQTIEDFLNAHTCRGKQLFGNINAGLILCIRSTTMSRRIEYDKLPLSVNLDTVIDDISSIKNIASRIINPLPFYVYCGKSSSIDTLIHVYKDILVLIELVHPRMQRQLLEIFKEYVGEDKMNYLKAIV